MVGLAVPPQLGLEQGRTTFDVDVLRPGEVHEHVLRLRPPGPTGRFTINVRNLSFRSGLGQVERVRGHTLPLEVEPGTAEAAQPLPSPAGGPARPSRRPSIFVSYRRADSLMLVPGLVRDLGGERKLKHVDFLLDLDYLTTGQRFWPVLDMHLQSCTALIAVIGRDWAGPDGARIAESEDPVRREIRTVVRRGVPIIPLLVGVPMPPPERLPPDVRPMTERQGFRFDLLDYSHSVDRLAADIRTLIPSGCR
ncbi:MAG: hypothetical protein AB7J32_25480 [Pseudonocardia sp.]